MASIGVYVKALNTFPASITVTQHAGSSDTASRYRRKDIYIVSCARTACMHAVAAPYCPPTVSRLNRPVLTTCRRSTLLLVVFSTLAAGLSDVMSAPMRRRCAEPIRSHLLSRTTSANSTCSRRSSEMVRSSSGSTSERCLG
jgi:hypothetical protein